MSNFNSRNFAAFGLPIALAAGTLPAMAATDTDGDGVPCPSSDNLRLLAA